MEHSESLTESIRLFQDLAGSNEAADELFDRYVHRLTSLVRVRMSRRLSQRLDAEDVVQSAYRSFFRAAQQGRFEVTETGDLWRLLAAITLNKLSKQIEKHQAAKRDIRSEASPNDTRSAGDATPAVARDPSVDSVAMMEDEILFLLSELDEQQGEMFSLRLAGYQLEEIASETGRSERTVRRTMDKVKALIESRM